ERFKSEDICGLHTKSGRDRKSIIVESQDKESILAAIKSNCQVCKPLNQNGRPKAGKKYAGQSSVNF
ncbi:hypothetical protein EZS27_041063, partial [termite gut metagenome]